MQTKQQQTVTKFLNKQAQTYYTADRDSAPEPTTVMSAVATVLEFVIISMPFAIAIAGFCGAFDALVK